MPQSSVIPCPSSELPSSRSFDVFVLASFLPVCSPHDLCSIVVQADVCCALSSLLSFACPRPCSSDLLSVPLLKFTKRPRGPVLEPKPSRLLRLSIDDRFWCFWWRDTCVGLAREGTAGEWGRGKTQGQANEGEGGEIIA